MPSPPVEVEAHARKMAREPARQACRASVIDGLSAEIAV
jgi:hypothetical protein